VYIIRIFELGYARDIDLAGVCRLVNRAQRVVRAEVETLLSRLVSQTLGCMDTAGAGCSRYSSADGPECSSVSLMPIEDNLFSMTYLPGSIVLSLHETEGIRNRAGRSAEQYIAQSALSEFLQIRYMLTPSEQSWHDLAHIEVRGCLFDFVRPNRTRCTSCAGATSTSNAATS